MVQHRRFMDMALADEGLVTPDGVLGLKDITRADLVRSWSRDSAGTQPEYSATGAVGGALIGGALAGPLGALGGGLLGSTAKRPSGDVVVPHAVSATLIFESADLAYSTTVGRSRIEEAQAFVAAVKREAGL